MNDKRLSTWQNDASNRSCHAKVDQKNMCYMKTQLLHTAAMAIALLFSNLPTVMGIENLQIRVQGMNAVLSWPSVEGETFINEAVARAANYPDASGINIGNMKILGYNQLRYNEYNTP